MVTPECIHAGCPWRGTPTSDTRAALTEIYNHDTDAHPECDIYSTEGRPS